MFSIQAVPSIFESNFGFNDWFATEVFQLKVHQEHAGDSQENIIIFNYKVSPVAI